MHQNPTIELKQLEERKIAKIRVFGLKSVPNGPKQDWGGISREACEANATVRTYFVHCSAICEKSLKRIRKVLRVWNIILMKVAIFVLVHVFNVR